MCAHKLSCVFFLLGCVPAYVEHILPAQCCDLVSLYVCVTVCVLSAQGGWPILSLFLDNGCIYILILDYLADTDEGFLSAWRMQTAITIP